jgi:hypothetical protein
MNKYEPEMLFVREGSSLQLAAKGGADLPTWDLTLRIGTLVKTVRLSMGYPADLERLRDSIESMGGPQARMVRSNTWTA